ncbi:type II toxin-antitoxin system RelE/ParE family toxin [Phenylobacterium aquaticum]|uniref:type II toxin-antitoxin system RelE/ParE family toxin n=1 Tax=Phenylobacterium aquaticum TaxID=1763816 RepID=UPI0026EFF79D|nr:type II toxin-antitoxin system RelE/ParE family toxin [Phenylobacterium aquaticum]
MIDKPIVLRETARRDVEAAVEAYAALAGTTVALGFISALESAYRAISAQPAAGSPRYGQELDLPGLRSRLLGRFPYLIFYIERDSHVDVWRVLHAHQDIPAWLQPPP